MQTTWTWTNFRRLMRRCIIWNEHSFSVNDSMTLYTLCHEAACRHEEELVLRWIVEAFIELIDRHKMMLEIYEDKKHYILDHPIIANKDMNAIIANLAFGDQARQKDKDFEAMYFAKVDGVRRITAYLHRFWIPNRRGDKITVGNFSFAIRPINNILGDLYNKYYRSPKFRQKNEKIMATMPQNG